MPASSYPYTVTYRSVKGSLLTANEVDQNFLDIFTYKAEISGSTGTLQLPAGTTAQRYTGFGKSMRWNSDLTCFETYDGTRWVPFSGHTGQVLQEITFPDDAGSSTTSLSFTNLSGSSKTITPKSTSSIITVECTFLAQINLLAATNTIGYAQLMESGSTIGSGYSFSVENGSGNNRLTFAGVVRARLTNASLSTRSFTIAGATSHITASCSITAQSFKITETAA